MSVSSTDWQGRHLSHITEPHHVNLDLQLPTITGFLFFHILVRLYLLRSHICSSEKIKVGKWRFEDALHSSTVWKNRLHTRDDARCQGVGVGLRLLIRSRLIQNVLLQHAGRFVAVEPECSPSEGAGGGGWGGWRWAAAAAAAPSSFTVIDRGSAGGWGNNGVDKRYRA